MPRPKKHRCLRFRTDIVYFSPKGVPLRNLEEIELFHDEIEALKLYELDGLDQKESAKKMKISQPTFMRIVNKGIRKVVSAIVEGKAIRIQQEDTICYGNH